jgi:hypothetical protein
MILGGFGGAVSFGTMAHGFAGFCKELVVFGAVREGVAGDEASHFQEEAALFAGRFGGAGEQHRAEGLRSGNVG